jgi:hypothetical protein
VQTYQKSIRKTFKIFLVEGKKIAPKQTRKQKRSETDIM